MFSLVISIPAFGDNYIWLIQDRLARKAVIVDPGDADPVLEVLGKDGLEPVAILITHRHPDHVGGIGDLLDRYPGLPVYGPAGEKVAGMNRPLGEGDGVELEAVGAVFRVLDVPGHTSGHIAYYGAGVLFCGDTLFTAGCGRLFEGTPEQMSVSLAKIAALPRETLIYCAHEYTLDNIGFAKWVEPDNADLLQRERDTVGLREKGLPTVPATLDLELRTNPFLRVDIPQVVRAAENHAGRQLNNAAEVFGNLRAWKDREYD